ncbi:hypothetical protein Shyhy01_51300 [Streptomyces hygroscopicus subsp. hygroscopicus]|nr:hypothetical protein Shyhy01_51300 [Streptomyces hygroscopicus subsp. hygroscopicus]
MPFQREVPQPHVQPVAVAGTQGAYVVQGGAAVGALEFAPDVEDDGVGAFGGGVAHDLQSSRPAKATPIRTSARTLVGPAFLPAPSPPAPGEEATRRSP